MDLLTVLSTQCLIL